MHRLFSPFCVSLTEMYLIDQNLDQTTKELNKKKRKTQCLSSAAAFGVMQLRL